MINKCTLQRLLKEKREIDEIGNELTKRARVWTEELKAIIGPEPFSKNGIDWADVCQRLIDEWDMDLLAEHRECHDNERV